MPDSRMGRSASRLPVAERRKRRAAFKDVMDFLDDHGYYVERGWGEDSEVAYRQGHTLRLLAEQYEDPKGDPREGLSIPVRRSFLVAVLRRMMQDTEQINSEWGVGSVDYSNADEITELSRLLGFEPGDWTAIFSEEDASAT